MSGGDDIFTCPECHQSGDYFDTPKRFDRRVKGFRIVCGDCASQIDAELSRSQELAPYQRASESSRDGAKRAAGKVADQANKVLALIVAAGETGLIEEEITRKSGLPRNESTRAINGLHSPREGLPLARKASFRRKASSGVACQVYVATDAGRKAILGRAG